MTSGAGDTGDAEQAGSVEPARRYRALLETQALLARVSREMGPALSLQPVLDRVLEAMRTMVRFRGGSIALLDERGLRVAASDPPVDPEVAALRLPVGTGLSGRAAATGETVYSPDLDRDDRVDPEVRRTGSNAAIRSYLAVPLITLGTVTGVLQIDSEDPDAFSEEDRMLLEGLATQVAGAIESAQRFEQVAELERLKSDFIARVSHELRTPVTIISGFVGTMLAHGDQLDDERRRGMLERIDAAAGRLSGLIDELLMLSRLQAGGVIAVPAEVDMAELLNQVRKESLNPARVTVDCPADHVETTDAALLRRALTALVDNALKYAGDAELRAAPGRIDLVDHGPGIPDHLQDAVWELFTRGQDSTATAGFGLGLPMARTLLEAIDARLELVRSDVEGTHLQVVLP